MPHWALTGAADYGRQQYLFRVYAGSFARRKNRQIPIARIRQHAKRAAHLACARRALGLHRYVKSQPFTTRFYR